MAKRGNIKQLNSNLNKKGITSAKEYTPVGRITSLIIGLVIGILMLLFGLILTYNDLKNANLPWYGICLILVGIIITILSMKINKTIKNQDNE